MQKINEAGLEIIKGFESLKLAAYLCPGGKWTIGYGHTGPDVEQGMVITEEDADDLLEQDLNRFEAAVKANVSVELDENQFSALVSLVYNIGVTAFRDSTLRKKLNTGDYEGAADEFPRWNRSKGKVLAGLARRRAAEQDLFLEDV